jgi:hypothetical protein
MAKSAFCLQTMVGLMRTNMTPSLKFHVLKSALLGRTPGRFFTDVGTVRVDGGTRTLAGAVFPAAQYLARRILLPHRSFARYVKWPRLAV